MACSGTFPQTLINLTAIPESQAHDSVQKNVSSRAGQQSLYNRLRIGVSPEVLPEPRIESVDRTRRPFHETFCCDQLSVFHYLSTTLHRSGQNVQASSPPS